jgi:transcriptional regulator with XRE-family HTH domain
VAAKVRAAIAKSGLTSAQFAELIGTSASRLSTYGTGAVVPSAQMLVRIESVAAANSARARATAPART